MSTDRMEAFSDGVVASLITVMVLELPKCTAPTGRPCDGLPLMWLVPDRGFERTLAGRRSR